MRDFWSRSSYGSKQRSGGSYLHAPNEPDLRYGIADEPNTLVVELEVDEEFASVNPLLTLRVQQGLTTSTSMNTLHWICQSLKEPTR